MYEKLPPISQDDIDGAWNAALRANSAYDGWQIAKNPDEEALATATAEGRLSVTVGTSVEVSIRITSFRIGSIALGGEVSGGEADDEEITADAALAEQFGTDEYQEGLSEEEAELRFRQLSSAEILGQMMLREDSPFDISSNYEPSPDSIEAEPTTAEVFSTLPYEYRKEAIDRFSLWTDLMSLAVDRGIVPEDYLLDPDDESLLEQAIAVCQDYEVMKEKGLEPEIVFVPRKLDTNQWDGLLKGFMTPNERESEGVRYTWADYAENLTGAVQQDGMALWELAVISGSENPAYTNISADGLHGEYPQGVIASLMDTSDIVDPSHSPQDIIGERSPSLEAYYALQLSKLARGENPVDAGDLRSYWTILREDIDIDGVVSTLVAHFDTEHNEVYSTLYNTIESQTEVGIRPSRMGSDALKPSQNIDSTYIDDDTEILQF